MEAILSGQLAAGEEVSEVSLAAQLEISRTPVAQAVQRLAALGLIERPNARPPRVARFGRAEVIDLYEMRQLLEGETAARAATRLPPELLEALQAEADRLRATKTAANWPDKAVAFDVRFHDVLASVAGNQRLCTQVRQHRLLVRAFCRSTADRKNLTAAMEEHRRILAALAARDPERARAEMIEHIAHRLAVVLAELYPIPSA